MWAEQKSASGWRIPRGAPSLADVFRTIPVSKSASFGRKMAAFAGPGYLVAVGYMDPGNWATSLAGGSAYGYTLLSVIMISNLMAIFLQALTVRLGIVTGRDLAQACRDHFGKWTGYFLWILCEIAIIATDLAEVIGTAIALNLLFGMPLTVGVMVTALDVFLLLMLQNLGFRKLEAFVITLLIVIAICFAYNIALAQPDFAAVLNGFLPKSEVVVDPGMLFIAIGILGATVMPHNLYLHSSIVQTRETGDTDETKRESIKFATLDSTIALVLALFINSAILILAAAVFHESGHTDVAEIQDAYKLLTPLLGGAGLASLAFGIALLASGLNSTVTATLAGQIVMEGFLNIRLPMWLRRLITRGIAIMPAIFAAYYFGDSGTAQLLILSQVILSLQLPFAVIPLMMFVGDAKKMGNFVVPMSVKILGWTMAAVILVLNAKLLWDAVTMI